MPLLSERIVTRLSAMPGGEHSFLKQLCGSDGDPVLDRLRAMVQQIGEPMESRATMLLSSLENRRFFQGFAEVSVLSLLLRQGWRLTGMHGAGPRLEITRADGAVFTLAVLSFLHQTRPGGDVLSRQRLVDALSRVASRHRFVVLIRRWLPHDLNPDPVRRSLELWLQKVSSGTWDGRYAAYEDESLSLEFCLTGERADASESPLAFALGPYSAHRAMEVLEPRVVRELDRHVAGLFRSTPLLIAAVSDQPWDIHPGYLRDFLCGRPDFATCEPGSETWEFGGGSGPCAFRDPLYDAFSGLLMVDRQPARPLELRAEALLNPWAKSLLSAADVGVRSLTSTSKKATKVLKWTPDRSSILALE